MQFDTAIEKTDKGFGIYFTVAAGGGGLLAVDGFVEDLESLLEDGQARTNGEALAILQLGDVLTQVNGEDCRGKEVAEILGLLRAAHIGSNTLSFSRSVSRDNAWDDEATPSNDVREAADLAASVTEVPTSGFMGALLKVKSKIRAEIDGDEEEMLREQLEDERFEKQWLDEFEVLKKQYEAKWETCTYAADEFCGLLYRSGDIQQKDFLLHEYPTLMEAWKDDSAPSGSSRMIPGWPAAKLTYDNIVTYDPVDCSETPSFSSAGNDITPRSIHCSQSLQKTLECLRMGFMWRSDDLRAFSRRLDAVGISSCSGLLEVLDARSGYFERNFQSKEYPRLSKTMLRALRENAQKAVAAPSKSTCLLPMDPFQRSIASA